MPVGVLPVTDLNQNSGLVHGGGEFLCSASRRPPCHGFESEFKVGAWGWRVLVQCQSEPGQPISFSFRRAIPGPSRAPSMGASHFKTDWLTVLLSETVPASAFDPNSVPDSEEDFHACRAVFADYSMHDLPGALVLF